MSLISIVLLTKYHWSFGPPSWTTADVEMGTCAAVSAMFVAPCGAITCILRQCVHNKDDYNENNHTGFFFNFQRGGGTQNEGIQSQRGGGGA